MDKLFFRTLVTKSLVPNSKADDERFFEGLLTVEMKDKQGEVTIVEELYKVLPIWMDRGAPITDTHSNRVVGKGINYARTEAQDAEGNVYPAIKITGKIHKDYELDDDIWSKIKSGEYKGLSFGGATKTDRQPVRMKDGSIAYSLSDLEHYEVAVCEDPAVPLALITDTDPIAKATVEHEDLGNGKMKIKCEKFGCYVDKVDFSNADGDRHGMYNQDVHEDESSGRKLGKKVDDLPIPEETRTDAAFIETPFQKDDSGKDNSGDGSGGFGNEKGDEGIGEWQGTGHPQPKETDKSQVGQERYGGVRGLGGYNTAQQGSEPTAQITEVPEKEENNDKKQEIYIKEQSLNTDNNMADDKELEEKTHLKAEDSAEDEVSNKKKDSDKEEEEKAKAFETSLKTSLDGITDQLKSVADSLKGIDSRVKALETPTDLPAKPAVSDSEDIGADITVPAKPYPQGDQAGLDDDGDETSNDAAPSMQEKPLNKAQDEQKLVQKSEHTITTETPRPMAALEKAGQVQQDFSPILKDARANGFEGLSNVARDILKGKYYTPTPEEVAGF